MCVFHMSTAQLKTMHLNETGSHNKLMKVLENVKRVREQYETKVAEQSIWESNVHNSIGLSSFQFIFACQSKKKTGLINCVYCAFSHIFGLGVQLFSTY